MTDQSIPSDQPLMASCRDCGHHWAVCYVPMSMGMMGSILASARCPYCGASSRKVDVDTARRSAAISKVES